MKQKVYLIRHGHTAGTEEKIMYGATELPVTEAGLDEIRKLAELGVYPDPQGAHIYTSGMYRTEQTLEAMYGEIAHDTEPLLREVNIGQFEMMPFSEVMNDEYGAAWFRGEIPEEELSFIGGDSMPGFDERVNRGFRNIVDAGDERAIAVIHGGVISFIMRKLFPGVCDDVWEWTPQPGLGYEIDLEDGKATGWSDLTIMQSNT